MVSACRSPHAATSAPPVPRRAAPILPGWRPGSRAVAAPAVPILARGGAAGALVAGAAAAGTEAAAAGAGRGPALARAFTVPVIAGGAAPARAEAAHKPRRASAAVAATATAPGTAASPARAAARARNLHAPSLEAVQPPHGIDCVAVVLILDERALEHRRRHGAGHTAEGGGEAADAASGQARA